MKKCIALIPILLCWSLVSWSQGCISVRNLVGFGQFALPEYNETPPKWLINFNSRGLRFHKAYIGDQNQNVAPENEIPTSTYVLDMGFTRILDKGWSISADLPISSGHRTSWQEHGNDSNDKTKYTTSSFGVGDLRIAVLKWLWDVTELHRGNIQVGLGLKLPTGNYDYQDYFHRKDAQGASHLVLAPVNFTLQLGDGGTGVSLEFNSYYTASRVISLYANAFYLINPRDVNGTAPVNSSSTGFKPEEIEATANVNSVPDVFTFRAGANFRVKKFLLGMGARVEGTPVHDLAGNSNGLRRAGTVVSIEPGINYQVKNMIIYTFVPVSVYKQMKQIVPDERLNRPTAGGIADYNVFMGVLFKI